MNEDILERSVSCGRALLGSATQSSQSREQLGHGLLAAHHGVEAAGQVFERVLDILKAADGFGVFQVQFGEPLRPGTFAAACARPSTVSPIL